jgi:hypothetical protein
MAPMFNFSQSLSKVSLSARKSLFLCFLLVGLISTQWIGLWHSVSHTNAQIQKISALYLDKQDDFNSSSHSGAACQLLDHLALANILINSANSIDFSNSATLALNKVVTKTFLARVDLPYQSRAPPTTLL